MKVIIPCFIVVENAESVDDADNQAVFLAESINSTLRDAADNDCSVYLDERLPSWVAGDSEVVDCAAPHAFDACTKINNFRENQITYSQLEEEIYKACLSARRALNPEE